MAILLISCMGASSQSTFVKKYLMPGILCQLVQRDHSGNIYCTGTLAGNKAFVLKCDSSGNPLWGKIIGSAGARHYPGDMLITDQQDVLIFFHVDSGATSNYVATLILKMDMTGQLIYSKMLGNSSKKCWPNNVIADSNGFTLSCQYTDTALNHGYRIIQFDSAANILREGLFSLGGNPKIRKLADGNYCLYDDHRTMMYYLDSSLSQASYREVDDTDYSWYDYSMAAMSSDSLIYHFGSSWYHFKITCTDIDMTTTWTKEFTLDPLPFPIPVVTPNYLAELPDKSWFLEGCIHYNGIIKRVLMHADSSFSTIRMVQTTGVGIIHSLNSYPIVLPDGRIIFSGSPVDSSGFTNGNIELACTDTAFTDFCDVSSLACLLTPIGGFSYYTGSESSQNIPSVLDTVTVLIIDSIPVSGFCNDSTLGTGQLVSPATYPIQIFQQPEKELVTIDSEIEIQGYSVYDITGRLLFQRTLSSKQFSIDTGNWATGLKIIKFNIDHSEVAFKLFIE